MKLFTSLFATFLVFTSCFMQAQSYTHPANVAKIGLSVGGDIEMPHGLGYEYLLNTASDVNFNTNGLPFTEGELTNMECDNPTLRLGFSFNPARLKKTEIQLSFLSIEDRIDKVHYETADKSQYLDVSATNKETAFEAVMLMKDEVGPLRFYAGGGANVGLSHDGKVLVKGYLENSSTAETDPNDIAFEGQYIDETYTQRNGINQRLFVQAGMGIRLLKRMEIGFECRKGFGYRATFDGPFTFTTLKRSLGFSLKYALF